MNFDLNINNYKKNELIEMFDLPPNYGRDLVDIKETKLRESERETKESTERDNDGRDEKEIVRKRETE